MSTSPRLSSCQRFLSQQASRSALEDQQQQAAAAAQQALTRLVDDGRREQEAKRSMVRHVSHEIRCGDEFGDFLDIVIWLHKRYVFFVVLFVYLIN